MQYQIVSSSLLLLTFGTLPVLAHNIQTGVDVGVTFHIEPNHSPTADTESQAWFALTRRGGELIPLSQCNCQLKVYLEKNNTISEPILNPDLIALSPEQYQNIPGANIIFPQAGVYQLELTGKPATEGDFSPFQVSYPVTVKPSLAKPKPPQTQETITPEENSTNAIAEETKSDGKTESNNSIYLWAIASVITITSILTIFKSSKKNG